MKTRILISLLCLFSITSLQAQEYYLRTPQGGHVSFEKKIADIDSIKLTGSNSIIHYANDYMTFPYLQVDSITFDTASVFSDRDIYVTYNGSSVTIINPLASSGVSIVTDGAGVSVTAAANITDITYHLSGSTPEGYFHISSDKRFNLSLEGVSITCSTGAAFASAIDKTLHVVLANNSSNFMSDGANGTQKAAFYSKGQVYFNGSGTLTVAGHTKHAISSDDYVVLNGGHIVVTAAVSDGLHGDYIVMNGGSVSISGTSSDGIDGDSGFIEINDGEINVNVAGNDAKGIKCDSIMTINGGTISVTASGDQSKALRSGQTIAIHGGTITLNATGTYVSETTSAGVELSYCTGIKAGGDLLITGGDITITCPASNAGGKAINTDGSITITGGTLDLTATGTCAKYLVTGSTYDSYVSTCLKSNANITISGGTITADAGGRAIKCDGNYTQSGGNVVTTTSAIGFTTMGTGTSCTDGFAPACLNVDGNIVFEGGTFLGTSSGKGGRGIVCDNMLRVGNIGDADSLILITVKTSGAPVNATSGGFPGGGGGNDPWKGLPKGIKIEGNIVINSGHVQSFCSQTSGSTNGEAMESKDSLFIYGGYVETNAYDDAINAAGYIEINGGHVWAYSRNNDAIDCNGTRIMLNGGVTICRGSECAIDDNDDSNQGGHLRISNATLIAIGGNMGAIEGTPTLTGQKYLLLGSSGGGGWPGGGGGSSSATTLAQNGVCVKNSSGTEVFTFKMPTVSNGNSGFEDPSKRVSGFFITTPAIQTGNYTYFTSPTITGGTQWHGLYSGATVTTSGNGTSTTAH